jgi:DHA1 family bicyclomycin/chloramphenicol resistance-like MFS transporter
MFPIWGFLRLEHEKDNKLSQATIPSERMGGGTFRLTALLGLLTAFAPLSTDMYLAAFPAMAKDMATSVDRIQMSLSVFFFGLAVGQLAYGPLSDRLGRRRPLLAGLALYTASSVGLAMTSDIAMFLALRFFQAVGGCSGMIIGRAVIRDSFSLTDSAKVFTVMMAVQSLGPVAAPVIGAYVLSVAAWPKVFAVMVFLGLGSLAAAYLELPETLPAQRRLRQSPGQIVALLWGLARKGDFIIPALAGAIGGSAIFAFISGSPFVLMSLHGLTETQYGWTFGLFSLGVGVFSQLNYLLLKKFSARAALGGAVAAMAIMGSALAVSIACLDQTSLYTLMILLFAAILPMPIIYANATALAMASSGKNAGSASSLIGVLQFVMAGAISFLTSFMHDGTALPMALMVAACGIGSLAVMALLSRFWGHPPRT